MFTNSNFKMMAFFTVIGSIAYTIRKLINNVGDLTLICDQPGFFDDFKVLDFSNSELC